MSGSAYGIGSASGSTAQGGRTTSVQLRTVGLDPIDKKVVCKAICVCSREPDRGASGQHLKQQCVSRNLRDVDRSMDWQSPYKAEVNYDMSQVPPAPIMRSHPPLEAHPYLPGWIAKCWLGGQKAYRAGSGAIRRPDVVIVKNGSLPPTQDNIKSLVEVKFPPQAPDLGQAEDYATIAGSPDKLVVLGPQNCDCSNDDEGENPIRAVVSDALSELGRSLRALLNSRPPTQRLFGMPPVTPPLPAPL